MNTKSTKGTYSGNSLKGYYFRNLRTGKEHGPYQCLRTANAAKDRQDMQYGAICTTMASYRAK